MSDAKLGTWTVPESPVSIEYSLVVVDEIRRAVTEGYQKLSRGGIEVGGILYGVRDGGTVRLLATRPIACEHARGPAFQFSENDRAALAAQLRQDAQDPQLAGLVSVGWFVSHTRTGIQLADSDLEIYNSFFPESYEVTLVVHPGRAMSMRAGFFIREFDGTLRTESSYLEFSFPDRLAAIFERPPRTDAPGPERRGNSQPIRGPIQSLNLSIDPGSTGLPTLDEYGDEPEPEADQGDQGPSVAAAAPPRKNWIWLMVWALAVLGLGLAGWRYFTPAAQADPIGLVLAEKDGVLQVQWNHSARSVTGAARGNLDINDGKQTRSIALSATDLARGGFAYQRSTGDVEVRLSVESSGGASVQEVSRYIGSAPSQAKTEDIQALEQRRDELEKEVERLRGENSQQDNRIQQLERTVRILQTRLGQK